MREGNTEERKEGKNGKDTRKPWTPDSRQEKTRKEKSGRRTQRRKIRIAGVEECSWEGKKGRKEWIMEARRSRWRKKEEVEEQKEEERGRRRRWRALN